MYADKDKQREANRNHAKAYRLRKGMTQNAPESIIPVIPEKIPVVIPAAIRTKVDAERAVSRMAHHPTCRCFVCVPPKGK
jgi:hypothetical protein